MNYQWRKSARCDLDPNVFAREVEAASNEDGFITPHDLVRRARAPKNPLHSLFIWDDKKAAEKQRIEHARYLLASIETKILDDGGQDPQRIYVNVRVGGKQQAYTKIEAALNDDTMRAYVLSEALRELNRLRRKYKNLKALAEVFRAVDKIDQEAILQDQ